MALTLGDNFSYQGAKPLDARLVYSTVASMKAVADSTMYDGCMAYCTATSKTYQWKSTNAVDETTGKWREFSGGSGLPSGGTTGQALVKHSNTDDDVEWADVGDTIQVDTLPTAGVDELGNVYQYIGSTTLTLTHGYFYECVSDGESTPTYSWEVCDVVDTLSAADVTDIKNAFSTQAFSERGITIDARGTELEVGTYIDANGTSHKLYQKTYYSSDDLELTADTGATLVIGNYDSNISIIDCFGSYKHSNGNVFALNYANISSTSTLTINVAFDNTQDRKIAVRGYRSTGSGTYTDFLVTIRYIKTA